MAQEVSTPMRDQRIYGLGLCECGCGRKTAIATQNHPRFGWVKGQPKRFIRGHSNRRKGPEYVEEDRGYATPCWIWQGADSGDGYGSLSRNGRTMKAHRVYYEHYIGPILDGLQLDHLCRNRMCVNPSHLEPVTHAENARRGVEARMHCKHGHEYTPENTYERKNGQGRGCRKCIAAAQRAYQRRKKAIA